MKKDCSDAQLLERFIADRDEAAFESLIERHGGLVWGVCRRALASHHDAEDAFQATFLVLATKAAAIAPREMLPNWLYGVACRTALRARAATAKRYGREKQVDAIPELAADSAPPQDERWWFLDRELSHLPDKYRVPIVLCELESLTHHEAARRLGCPVGTLSARLSRGKALLAKRLGRRGLALTVSTLVLSLAPDESSAQVCASLAGPTAKAAALIVRGRILASGLVSTEVAELAQGVMKTMILAKLKGLVVIVASLAAAGTMLVLATRPPHARIEAAAFKKLAGPPGAGAEPEPRPESDSQRPGQTGSIIGAVERPTATTKVAFQDAPAGRAAEPAEPPKVPPAGAARIWNVALSPDGQRLAAGAEGVDGKPAELIVWELASRRELLRVQEPRASRSVAFSPDGRTIATGGFGTVARIFDARTGRIEVPLRGHTKGINAVAFSPDGKTLATGSWDTTVKLWNVATGQARVTLRGHNAQVFTVAFSPDGRSVASGSVDGTARIWDADSGAEKSVLKGHNAAVEYGVYSPDGKMLATAGWDGTVRLWDPSTGRPQAVLEGPSDQLGIGFSPDGKTLASLSAPDNEQPGALTSILTLWDVATHERLAAIPAHGDRSYSVLFTPDGKTLVTSSMDRTIKLWDIATRRSKATLNSVAAPEPAADRP